MAKAWADPPSEISRSSVAEDLRRQGIPEESIATLAKAMEAAPEERVIEVEAENLDAWMVFQTLATQWVKAYVGMEGVVVFQGLNYLGVDVAIRMQGYRGQKARDIFQDIQVMEFTALPILNRRK